MAEPADDQRAARRLRAFRNRPRENTALEGLFKALQAAERATPHFLWLLFYVLTLLKITLFGLLLAFDVNIISRATSFNAQSIGHRLRLKTSISSYTLLARAGVGYVG